VITEPDRRLLRHGDPVPTQVRNEDSGRLVHIGTDEEAAFWDWASVGTLRHSGVRIEELCELTHLSIRQYRRANGEVIHRRARAGAEGWAGETEGIDLAPAFPRTMCDEAQRLAQRPTVDLGIPTPRRETGNP
jgi:hypothetical protein